jgi:hypothetical protein
MEKVQCPKCHHTFEGSALKGAAAAAVSAYFGGSIGIIGEPLGTIAGTVLA